MDVQAVTLFLALLAVATQAFTTSTVGLALASRVFERARPALDAYLDALRPHALQLALGIAVVSTAGSLYFSEVAKFVPCELCWYQRIAMYPLVPILALAVVRRDKSPAPYVVTVATLGGMVSAYHIIVERLPAAGAGFCDPSNPCNVIWVNRFGYLTIPTMALSAFAGIATLGVIAMTSSEEE